MAHFRLGNWLEEKGARKDTRKGKKPRKQDGKEKFSPRNNGRESFWRFASRPLYLGDLIVLIILQNFALLLES